MKETADYSSGRLGWIRFLRLKFKTTAVGLYVLARMEYEDMNLVECRWFSDKNKTAR